MSSWRRLRMRIQRALYLPTGVDREMDDEIRFHLAEETRLQSERGLSAAEAATAARRAFGNVALAKENTRAVWVSTTFEQLVQDLRLGSRILTKAPAVSATAVILIALVIGGNTTVFSIAHGIISKPAPGVHATGLTTLSWVAENGDIETHTEYPVFAHFQEQSTALQIAAFDSQRVTLTHDNGSYAARAGIVSPNYFETFGVRLVKGRNFTREEAERGTSGLVVVIGHHLWQSSFAGADNIVGQVVTVNGQPATIVGVADPEFRGGWLAEMADLWVPLAGEFRQWLQPNRSCCVAVAMFGRRAPEVSLSSAQSELTTLWAQLQRAHPELNQKVRVRLVPYSATAGGNSIVSTQGNRMLAIFSVVTMLTIAIVCANVANLLIARAVVRQREMALRQSLGASRARIVRGLLAEGLVLSVVAWIAACLFAWIVSRSVVRLLVPAAQSEISMPDLTPDWTVVGYALVLAVLCTIAVTLGPALRTWRQQLLPFLKIGEQSVVQGRSTLSRGLVVLQLAFSVLLLTTAGLAQRSLSLQDSADVGFKTGNLLLATVNTSASADDAKGNRTLVEALRERLARLPGVEGASYMPGGGHLSNWALFPVRRDRTAEPVMTVDKQVGSDYFSTLGVPFIAGHDFRSHDTRTRRDVIVTRQVAEALWPGEPAIGKVLIAGPDDRAVEAEVVGVVRDAFFAGRSNDTRPRYVFFATAERPGAPGETTFYIRHSGSQRALGPAVARALREIDARVAVASLRSLESQIAFDAAPLWMLATLLTLFAGGSLLIAAIGQYAVVAFDSRRRIREFGVRIALGASSRQLVSSVVSESFRVTALGLVIGFALSVAVGTVLARVLYGVTPTDPVTFASVFVLLSGASLLASYLPARRAANTDPMVVLRTE
jgi:predicted permease